MRTLGNQPCELRMSAEGEAERPQITGYAAVFNTRSALLFGSFVEEIAPGAFDDVLGDDVRALFNHDPNFVLGRTRSNTLRLEVDSRGLAYTIDPPDTQTVRDLVLTPLKRGDVTGSSFGLPTSAAGFALTLTSISDNPSRGLKSSKVRTSLRSIQPSVMA